MHVDAQFPYQDPTLDPAQRADDLLSRLPLEDKAGLMFQPLAGIGDFDAPGPIGYPSTQTLLDRRINHFNTLQAPRRVSSRSGRTRCRRRCGSSRSRSR